MPASTRSLTATHIHQFVHDHCFTPGFEGWVGVELELLTTRTNEPLVRPDLDELLAVMATVEPPQGSRITLEPGGQMELSSRPCPGPATAVAATSTDLDVLRTGLGVGGITTGAVGLDFVRPYRRVLRGGRYDAMEAYFDTSGDTAGRAMMCATASTQVNLDLGEEDVLTRRWRLAHALGPVLIASFANSPLAAGRPTGAKSSRQQIWTALDPTRSAPVLTDYGPRSLGPAEAWARYAMAARVMLIRSSPQLFQPVGAALTFASWMANGHELGYPTLDDFAYHLGTLFPPVRPKGWLELRMIDALPDPWWQVAVAVTAALLDDPAALGTAERTCRPIAGLWSEAASFGLDHPGLASAAGTCFAAALDALPRLGVSGALLASTADYADRYVDRRRTPGDDLLDAWLAAPDPALLTSGYAPAPR